MTGQTYGAGLRNVRGEAGASLEEVATELGTAVSVWKLHRIETGKDDPEDPTDFRRRYLEALKRITERRQLAIARAAAAH